MKKRFLPLSMLLITIVLAQASFVANAAGIQGKYTPRSGSKATISSFMKSIRANQETGLIDPALMMAAQKAAQTTTKDGDLNWAYAGPDNFGGMTRAILYQQKNKQGKVIQTVLIGTIGGDIYETENGGVTFGKVASLDAPISCMVKASNGDIFIGTGEGRDAQKLNGLSYLNYEYSFVGKGVFKMAAGSTMVEQLGSTSSWAFVNDLTIANDKLYAATTDGIMVSADNGESWTNVLAGTFRSIKSNNNGDLLATDETDVYMSRGGEAFQMITGTTQLPSNEYPKVVALSPSDNNYMYIAYYRQFTALGKKYYGIGNVYYTKDNGENWDIAVAGNGIYHIFGAYTNPDNFNGFMTVCPNNPKKLLMGCDNLWVVENSTNNPEPNSYRPQQVSESFTYEYTAIAWNRYIYLHEGLQNIVFSPKNPNEFYVGTNGGVFKGEYAAGLYSYKSSNRYFITDDVHTSVTRMMSVGVGGTSMVLGGCLDHGTILMTGSESINNVTTGEIAFPHVTNNGYASSFFSPEYAGGPCAISTINPYVFFVSTTGALSTPIYRTETLGEDYNEQFEGGGESPVITNANAFKTPFAFYENYNDANNPIDTIFAPIRTVKYKGEMVYAYSVQAGYPVDHIITEEPEHDAAHMDTLGNYRWIPGDTIWNIHDPLSTLYICGIEDAIYMTRDALLFSKHTDWLKISKIDGIPSAIALNGNGDMALVGTIEGTLYKVTGLSHAYTAAQASVDSAACVVTCDSITTFANQAVTSISINPTNNKVIVTLGNYGNTNYVYTSNDGTQFTAASGIPAAPVYASLIEKTSGMYMIGTEFGLYTSTNGTSWTKSDAINSPVMELKQAVVANHPEKIDVLYDEMGTPTYVIWPGVDNEGMIYAATYGEGIIACNTYAVAAAPEPTTEDDDNTTVVADQLNIYPNPVRDFAQFDLQLNGNTSVSYVIYDLSGRMVTNGELGTFAKGAHTMRISTADLASGSYIIRLNAGEKTETAKFLVY